MKRATIATVVCVLALVIVCVQRAKARKSYCAVCRFAYWSCPVTTNDVEALCQPDFTGPSAANIVAPLLNARGPKFIANVIDEFLAKDRGGEVDAVDLSNLVSAVEIKVTGRAMPIVSLSVIAPSENTARRMIEAYVASLTALNSLLQENRHAKAIEQLVANISILRKQVEGMSDMDAAGSSGVAVDDIKQEKSRLIRKIANLEADLRSMQNSRVENEMRIQRLGAVSVVQRDS